jgi:chromate transporter
MLAAIPGNATVDFDGLRILWRGGGLGCRWPLAGARRRVAWPPMDDPAARPTFREALRFWLKLGCISFGGPAGQIAIMQRELVERRRWIGERAFLHALNFCMLLPGPEAQQLATYCGWRLHGVRGGLVAGGLFVLPSAVLLWVLSWAYLSFGHIGWVEAVFNGLKPAVLAIVLSALVRIGRRVLKNPLLWVLAAAAFGALFFLGAPFPVVIAVAAGLGLVGGRLGWLDGPGGPGEPGSEGGPMPPAHRDSVGRVLRVLAIGLVLWWLPVGVSALWLGGGHAVTQQGVFFSKAAMVTFGGAYAVLPYVSQQAVEQFGWVSPAQMIDGLALAETTPGPLIMVLQFVGFAGGWQQPGGLPPLLAATLGAAMTTWTTFVPCFLWIFLGAPSVERLRQVAWLHAALTAVTAAVVGVILNLAVWFALAVLLPPGLPVQWSGLAVAAAAFVALHRFHWDVVAVIALAAAAGLLQWAAGG